MCQMTHPESFEEISSWAYFLLRLNSLCQGTIRICVYLVDFKIDCFGHPEILKATQCKEKKKKKRQSSILNSAVIHTVPSLTAC